MDAVVQVVANPRRQLQREASTRHPEVAQLNSGRSGQPGTGTLTVRSLYSDNPGTVTAGVVVAPALD